MVELSERAKCLLAGGRKEMEEMATRLHVGFNHSFSNEELALKLDDAIAAGWMRKSIRAVKSDAP